MATTSYQKLAHPDNIARWLRGRKIGANDWRIPHLCGGERALSDNPGLSLSLDKNGRTIFYCHYGCDPDDTRAALAPFAVGRGKAPPPIAPRRSSRNNGGSSSGNGGNGGSGNGSNGGNGSSSGNGSNGSSSNGNGNGSNGGPSFAPGNHPCPKCGNPAGFQAQSDPRSGWPILTSLCSCALSYSRMLAALPPAVGAAWQAWADYATGAGSRRIIRAFPETAKSGKSKSRWSGKGPLAGLQPRRWLPDAPAQSIILAEGEKAAAAVHSARLNLPIVAASLPGAAAMATADYSPFAGCDITVWPDNDATGQAAAQRAIAALYRAGAATVRMVSPDECARFLPADAATVGCDAADLDAALVRLLIQRAATADPPVEKDDPYMQPLPSDLLNSASLQGEKPTCDGTMLRMLCADQGSGLLFAAAAAGSPDQLLVSDDTGVWRADTGELRYRVRAAAYHWAAAAQEAADAGRVKPAYARQVKNWAQSCENAAAQDRALASAGAVYHSLAAAGALPAQLLVSSGDALDQDDASLGARNGVINLQTGELLTGDAARARRVTRRIPDDYHPDAVHPTLDRLLELLPAQEADGLLDTFAFALGGQPAGQIVLLAGPPNSARSLLSAAVTAVLGDFRSRGYAMSLHPDALLRPRASGGVYSHSHQAWLVGVQDARVATLPNFDPEPDAALDTGLLSRLDGSKVLALRDVGDRAGVSRPAAATLFIPVSEQTLDETFLDTYGRELAGRLRVFHFPPQPPGRAEGSAADLLREPAGRQALLARLVRRAAALTDRQDPPQPPTYREPEDAAPSPRERAARWIRDCVEVTGDPAHRISAAELMRAAAQALGGDGRERAGGLTRKALLFLLKSHDPNFPESAPLRMGSQVARGYAGVRLKPKAGS